MRGFGRTKSDYDDKKSGHRQYKNYKFIKKVRQLLYNRSFFLLLFIVGGILFKNIEARSDRDDTNLDPHNFAFILGGVVGSLEVCGEREPMQLPAVQRALRELQIFSRRPDSDLAPHEIGPTIEAGRQTRLSESKWNDIDPNRCHYIPRQIENIQQWSDFFMISEDDLFCGRGFYTK